ncbi:MAG TPA: MFS transporter, partial [Planctomycetaceae bacterium]|nr:MFS transporter [Planctomycetaceae bacterium]
AAGTLRRPSIAELFSPELRTTTIVTTIMFAASYGVAFGAIQQMPQIVPGIDEVKAEIKAKTEGKPADVVKKVTGATNFEKASDYTKAQELGGLFGRFALAVVVVWFASRRTLLRLFLIPGVILMPLIFLAFARGQETTYATFDLSFIPGFHAASVSLLGIGIFLAGFFTVAQFSFWGNYLPHAYPVHLRGTGESFAANIGGRMIGTPFAALTQYLALQAFVPGTSPAEKTAYIAAAVATLLFLVNIVFSFVLPEPKAGVDHD